MTLENLYIIVDSLTKEEKIQLNRLLRLSNGNKSKYSILFNDLCKAKKWTRSDTERVKKQRLKTSSQIYRVTTYLLEKIVNVRVSTEPYGSSELSKIQVLYHFEAYSFGKKLLLLEIEKAQHSGNVGYLLQIRSFISDMDHIYKIKIDLSPQTKSWKDANSELEVYLNIRAMRDDLKSAIHLDQKAKYEAAGSVLDRVSLINFNELDVDLSLEASMLEVSALILQESFSKAIELQEPIVQKLKKLDIDTCKLLKEMSVLFRLHVNSSGLEAAERINLEMGLLNPSTPLERRVIARARIKNSMILCFRSYSVPLMETSWADFQENQSLFSNKEQASLIYFVAQFFFYVGNHPNSLKTLNRLYQIEGSGNDGFLWAQKLLKLALCWETQDFGEMELLIRSLENELKKRNLKSPMLVLKAFKHLYREGFLSQTFLSDAIIRCESYSDQQTEKWSLYYFNSLLWLKSKSKSISIAELDLANPAMEIAPLDKVTNLQS